MRPLTNRMFRFAGVLLLISLLAASDRSAGQVNQGVRLISLNFPGGTAVEYVAAIRKAAGAINVVIAPEAKEIQIPAVSVKQVTVAAALDLLDDRSRELHGRRVKLEVLQMPVYDTTEKQTYQVRAHISGRHTAQAASVWTVTVLLDHDISSHAVLSAVETALEVVGSTNKPDVRFHEDTALLIASGDHDQLEAIEQVLDRLHEAVGGRRDDDKRQVEMRLQAVDRDRQHARQKMAESMAEAKQRREENIALTQDIARLEMVTTELRRMLEAKDRELTAAMADVRALQVELQRERSRREPGRPNSGG
jgi:hypothetical protein